MTVNRWASASRSYPISDLGGITTSLSMMARLIRAVLADDDVFHDDRFTHFRMVLHTHIRRTSTEFCTRPPEMMQPPQTMESRATPMLTALIVLREDEFCRWKLPLIGSNRPLLVVEIEERIHRDEVHVRFPVRVQRSDVPPVLHILLVRIDKFVGVDTSIVESFAE